jgi:hypothetical protein
MKKIFPLLLMAMIIAMGGTARAATYTTYTTQLNDLAHDYYYTWRITANFPSDEEVLWAQLTIYNIYDWKVDEVDFLYIYLLDNPKNGVKSYWDDEGGGDNFSLSNLPDYLKGTHLETWSDPDGPKRKDTITITFDSAEIAALNLYLGTNNYFGFGFDPDCHYYNTKIKFTYTTGPPPPPGAVPEPSTLILLGMGMVGVAGWGLRKR